MAMVFDPVAGLHNYSLSLCAALGLKAKGVEPPMPRQKPSLRSIADAMAGDAADYALLAPPEQRDDVIASLVEGFRDGCIEYDISIEPDLAYYIKVVTAKVRELAAVGVESPPEKLN